MSYWSPANPTNHGELDYPLDQSGLPDDELFDQYAMSMFAQKMPIIPTNTSAAAPYLDLMGKLDDINHPANWDPLSSTHTSLSEQSHMSEPSTVPASPTTRRRSTTKPRRHTMSAAISPPAAPGDINREKNRVAASKCRRKKKGEEQELEDRRRKLQAENAMLQSSASALRDEVLNLKTEILKHGSCDFPPIRNYIETAAARVAS